MEYSSTCHERTPPGPGKSVHTFQVAAHQRDGWARKLSRDIDNVAVHSRWPLTTGVAQCRYYCTYMCNFSLIVFIYNLIYSYLENTDSFHDEFHSSRRVRHRFDDRNVILLECIQSGNCSVHRRHRHFQLRFAIVLRKRRQFITCRFLGCVHKWVIP